MKDQIASQSIRVPSASSFSFFAMVWIQPPFESLLPFILETLREHLLYARLGLLRLIEKTVPVFLELIL